MTQPPIPSDHPEPDDHTQERMMRDRERKRQDSGTRDDDPREEREPPQPFSGSDH